MPTFHNISAYKFIDLDLLPLLQADMHDALSKAGVLGTVLLANEGINVALAGTDTAIQQARDWFQTDTRFSDLWFKESTSTFLPFSKLKVRIRHEIIAFDGGKTAPLDNPAPNLDPATLKQWLDEGRKFTLLDTRNRYEVESGTFKSALALDIDTFRDFPSAAAALDSDIKDQPVVTFCTGGVRCEKAAPWMLQNGFKEVYQIEGGILNYLEQCGGEHWQGDCFVFDDRVEVDTALQETGALLCPSCHRAVPPEEQDQAPFSSGEGCLGCADTELTG